MASLYRAYEDPSRTEKEKKELVKGVQVREIVGGAGVVPTRNLGPALSARLHALLTATDPDVTL